MKAYFDTLKQFEKKQEQEETVPANEEIELIQQEFKEKLDKELIDLSVQRAIELEEKKKELNYFGE